MSENVYIGILLTATDLHVIFGKPTHDIKAVMPNGYFHIAPFAEGKYDCRIEFGNSSEAENSLIAATKHISEVKSQHGSVEFQRLGIASHGPILSLNPRDIADDPNKNSNYGRISPQTIHESLRGLPIYDIVTTWLKSFDCAVPLIINTDVTAGAIFEAQTRMKPPSLSENYIQHSSDSVLAFLNIADGVGGSYVAGNKPVKSALHPEFGYLPTQVQENDPLRESLLVQPGKSRKTVFMEDVLSIPQILKRAQRKQLSEVPEWDWRLISGYIAQLCASVTVLFAPSQIILQGPIFREALDDDGQRLGLTGEVRRIFPTWLESRSRKYPRFPELTSTTYLSKPSQISWPNGKGEHVKLNPMLGGALFMAMLEDVTTNDAQNG